MNYIKNELNHHEKSKHSAIVYRYRHTGTTRTEPCQLADTKMVVSYYLSSFLVLYYIFVVSSTDLVVAEKHKSCQFGYIYSKEKMSCECCSTVGGFVRCARNQIYVAGGHCFTWNNATQDVEICRCLYRQIVSCGNSYMYNISTNISGPALNDVVCRSYNRHGTHCSQCIQGYGPPAFSDGVTCADCSKYRHFWLLNLLFQLAMMTFLYLIIILFQIKGTSSPFNVIITYGQIGVNAMMVASGFYAKVICFTGSQFITFVLTILGVVNLDFFRLLIPPLCISASLKSINVLLLDYIIAVYPIILTIILYIGLELCDRYGITVHLKCCLQRNWNPRETLLSTCATFLLLSYSKFLFVSFNLLFKVEIYNCKGEIISDSALLLFDPQIKFFHLEHIPYVVLSFSVILIFVVLPPLVLLLYPTRLFRMCLSCCGFKRWDILHLIMDTFQGWYKNGTEGTYDYRPLSALYMILRIVLATYYIEFIAILDLVQHSTLECIIGAWHVFLGTMFLVVRPYKVKWMNNADGLILTTLGVLILTYFPENKIIYLVACVLVLCIIVCSFIYFLFKCTCLKC